MQGYIIGLDIGTSSVKAVAYDLSGRFLLKKSAAYPTHSPKPGWQEQNPEQVFSATLKCLRQAVAAVQGQLLGVSFSSAMHSLIAVDEWGKPLTPCILWSDNRSAEIAAKLKASDLGKIIYQHTGTPIHPMSPLPKLAWLRENQPALFQKTHKFLGIKEYVVSKLFGEYLTDYSVASATGLFDNVALDWFPPALGFAGAGKEKLPEAVPPAFLLKGLKREFAKKLGIPADIPFVIGASDGCLANLGAGAMQEGQAVLTIGTSGAFRMTTQKSVCDPRQRIFNYLLSENQFVTGGASNNGAVVYEWFTRQFFNQKPSTTAMRGHRRALAEIPAGCDGLLFLPYLFGERAPVWNATAQGVFFGIHAGHTRAHFHRAVLEGILLNLSLIGEVLEEVVSPIRCVFANGGFTKDGFWVQMAADVFGKEVRTFENEDSSAFGAALMGLEALGLKDGFFEMKAKAQPQNVFSPDAANHTVYKGRLEVFKSIYAHAEGAFENSGLSSKDSG